MNTMDKINIELNAQNFRIQHGLSTTEPINIKSLLIQCKILAVFLPLSKAAYGLSIKSSENERFILVNSSSTIGRQNFTVAHELYHLYYDDNPQPHISRKDGCTPQERKANYFASVFLMPNLGILSMLPKYERKKDTISLASIIKLEQYFQVSRNTMLIRLKELNLLSEDRIEMFSKIPISESAHEYGYDTSLYKGGNKNLVIGDYGEKARLLFENDIISEGHYNELLNVLYNGKN